MSPLCISVEEAARLLGIGRSTAYTEARAGRLPTIRWGRAVRVPVAGVEAMLRERIEAAAAQRAKDATL